MCIKIRLNGTLNTEKYDFVLFLALRCTKGGLSCGGGGASKQSVVQAYFEKGMIFLQRNGRKKVHTVI